MDELKKERENGKDHHLLSAAGNMCQTVSSLQT